MRKMRKIEALLLIGLVLAIGITLLIADGGIKQTDMVKSPLSIKWYPISGSSTPEDCTLESGWEKFDLDWLNR